MKKTAILLALIVAAHFTYAQDSYENDEIQTIFSKNRSNGGYGAFTLSYSNIDGQNAFVSGARGAFIFDHIFAIGLGGYGFINNLDYDYYHNGSNSNNLSLAGGYGGLFVEFIVSGKSPVHVSFPVLIGAGGIALVDAYYWHDWGQPYPGNNYNYDSYFVIEPAVELEFNLARFFRLAATVSYRHTSEIELLKTDGKIGGDVLRGFNYGVTFKFGKF